MTTDPPAAPTGVTEPLASQPRVLLVEDEADLARMLRGLLTEEGYAVDVAPDGHSGLHLGLTRRYEVAVLDRGLPAVEGLDLLARLRRSGVTTPVLVLSALGNPADRVAGFDAGAEDYLAKPFDIDELLARLRALRRRHLDTARQLPLGDDRLDLDAREVLTTHGRVALSERECELLATLAARPRQVFGRDDLLALAFPEAENSVVVDTYVHYVRRKLGREWSTPSADADTASARRRGDRRGASPAGRPGSPHGSSGGGGRVGPTRRGPARSAGRRVGRRAGRAAHDGRGGGRRRGAEVAGHGAA